MSKINNNFDSDNMFFTIERLKEANEIIRNDCKGTNDWKYDWTKNTQIIIDRARKSLNNLK